MYLFIQQSQSVIDRVGGEDFKERSRCKGFGTGKELSDRFAQRIMLVMGGEGGGVGDRMTWRNRQEPLREDRLRCGGEFGLETFMMSEVF